VTNITLTQTDVCLTKEKELFRMPFTH